MRRHPGNQSALRSANDSRRQLCLIKAPGREPFLWEQNNETHVICRDGPAGQRRGAGGRVQQRQYPNRNESVRGRAVSGGRQKTE